VRIVFTPIDPLGPCLCGTDDLESVSSKRTRNFEYPVVCTASITILSAVLIDEVILAI
jgi:hypothetical protein